MAANKIYNSKVHGHSIGLSFDYGEAMRWINESSAPGHAKEVVEVPYYAEIPKAAKIKLDIAEAKRAAKKGMKSSKQQMAAGV